MTTQPLADRIRPTKLIDIIGQEHLIGEGKLLNLAIKNKQLFSMILWGPPGVGKTTLARVIANEMGTEFYEFSAVNTGIAEIKKLIESFPFQGLLTPVLFIDEIHRFNKSQQDALLPHVETGRIILIGATTENPSFEVIGPLLSRTRVFVLKQLETEHLKQLIKKALKDKKKGLGEYQAKLKKDAINLLIDSSNGDARKLLNTLEIAVMTNWSNGSNKSNDQIITKKIIEEAIQQKALRYDKAGEEHFDTISAFIKSMRSSNIDAALYYLARMIDAGEDPLFISRRMVIFASEDIGMIQPTALVVANEVFRACETIGYPECQINLAHGAAYLASAKKDRSAYEAYFQALDDVKKFGNLPIPLKVRNAPTKMMKNLGYGKDYQMYSDEDLLPEKLKGKKYFKK